MRYWWEIPYVLAILQTNEPSMRNALNEAVAALEQRRLRPVNATEEIAVADAEVALKMLIGERLRGASETGRGHVKGEIKEKVGRFGVARLDTNTGKNYCPGRTVTPGRQS